MAGLEQQFNMSVTVSYSYFSQRLYHLELKITTKPKATLNIINNSIILMCFVSPKGEKQGDNEVGRETKDSRGIYHISGNKRE